ncbi:MAG: FG-GAP repeat protein [Phycisphaerales bacterium]
MTLAVLAAAGTAWGQNESFKMLASDGENVDQFGHSAAIDGDTAILGAPRTDQTETDSGSAYIFQQDPVDPDTWIEVVQVFAGDALAHDRFGTSVAISGDFVIVGAFLDDHSGFEDAGSAYIFYRDQDGDDEWGQVAHITASNAAAGDRFGLSVAIDGDVAIIGAPLGGSTDGAAYIFQRDGQGDWNETDILTASDGAAGDEFGSAVSISAETAIIGARGDDLQGAAYIFAFDGQDWVEEDKLTAFDGQAFDDFGFSVSISGDLAVVGARNHFTQGALKAGTAYIFDPDEAGDWGEGTILTPTDPAAVNDFFGWSVAISGNVVIVGTPANDDDGTNSGSASVFWEHQPGAQNGWGEVVKLTASDAAGEDHLGQAVAISGRTGLIGVRDDDDNGNAAGSAYIFDGVCPCPWDLDGDGSVGASDLIILLFLWGTDPGGPPDFDGDGNVGSSDLVALLFNWGLCPCVEGTPPLPLEEELALHCLNMVDWDDFEDKMQTGTEAQKENYLCWMLHYLEDCSKCFCTGASGCPGADPFN